MTDRFLVPSEPPALPEWHAPGHPILMGVGAIALAVAAWHGLLWRMERHPLDATTRARSAASAGATANSLAPDTAETSLVVAVAPRADSGTAPSHAPTPAAAPTADSRPRDPAPTPAPKPSTTRPTAPSVPAESPLSPFRRSHPWAAVPGKPYYYPSRCPATLRFPDLVFFKSQTEARANGFVPAPDSGCG